MARVAANVRATEVTAMAIRSFCRACGAGYVRGTREAHVVSHDPGRIAELGAWWEVFDMDTSPRAGWPESPPTPEGGVAWLGAGYSPTVERFEQTLYDTGWMVPFDWGAWSARRGKRLLDDPRRVAHAGPADLARILTTIFRGERFGDGTIADAFASGLIDAVLWRAREIGDGLGSREAGERRLVGPAVLEWSDQ